MPVRGAIGRLWIGFVGGNMQTRRAFALRDSLDADTFGGSVSLPDGTTFRVDDALVEGKGLIVTDDPNLIAALDGYIALRAAAVPKELAGYDGMTVDELDALIATRENIALPDNPKKSDKIAALVADDHRIIDEQTATDAAAAEASIVTNEGGAEGSDR